MVQVLQRYLSTSRHGNALSRNDVGLSTATKRKGMLRQFYASFYCALLVTVLTLSADSYGNEIIGKYSSPTTIYGKLHAVAEFEQTDGVLLAWDERYLPIYSKIASSLDHDTAVYFLLQSNDNPQNIRKKLDKNGVNVSRVSFITHPFDSMWTRDYGPISVRRSDGSYAVVNNNYADNRPGDDDTPLVVAEHLQLPVYDSGLVIEGGNFMTNGEGLCIMTSQVVYTNLAYNVDEIHQLLKAYFGCEQSIILEGLANEETDHVDIFAKFISPNTILVGSYDYDQDPDNAWILDRNAAVLQDIKLGNEQKLNVIRIPMGSNDDGIFRSYVNSLYVNNTLIMPTYGLENEFESEAISVYRRVLPRKTRIVTIDASDIIELAGAIHCIALGLTYGDLKTARKASRLRM